MVTAALLGDAYALIVVIGCHVLVAQSDLHLAKGQRTGILSKQDVVVFALLGERRGHDLLEVNVLVVASSVVKLGAHFQIAAPQVPREHEFGCA